MDSHEGGAARLLDRRCPRALSFSIDKILQPDFGCQRSSRVLPRVRAGVYNRTTGFHSAAWSPASGDNSTKVSENSFSDAIFHSIRGLLDVEEVAFSYPGIFGLNGCLGKQQTVKLIPKVLEQSNIYFSAPKCLVQGNDCVEKAKKSDNLWTLNSQRLYNDDERSFSSSKSGDFVLAEAWNFTNADSVLPSSSPTSKPGKTLSPREEEAEFIAASEFGGANNEIPGITKLPPSDPCEEKVASSTKNSLSENNTTQSKNNSFIDDVTSSTDSSPPTRQTLPDELKLKGLEISSLNVGKQDGAALTNFGKMRSGRHAIASKASVCEPSNSSTTAAINKDETEMRNDEGGSNYSFPCWLYCTRYSDRPSSGPRRRRKKKQICEVDEKRSRTAFSSTQLARLRQEFQTNRYLTEKRRTALATELELSESQVKIWFQNKRAKLKKAAGRKNPLALQLMAQGLYNHTSQK